MHATDQMVEMFSTAFKLEKGALGLFFEMNVLTGIGLFVYIFFLQLGMEAPEGLGEDAEQ